LKINVAPCTTPDYWIQYLHLFTPMTIRIGENERNICTICSGILFKLLARQFGASFTKSDFQGAAIASFEIRRSFVFSAGIATRLCTMIAMRRTAAYWLPLSRNSEAPTLIS